MKNSDKKKRLVNSLSIGICIGLVMFLLGTAGCRRPAPTTLEKDYGNAWAYNQAVQIADPKASLDQSPAVGLSPQASTNVMGAYNKSFSGQKSGAGTSTNINLGGLTTAGSGGGGSGGGGN
jgi:hypothetical protein